MNGSGKPVIVFKILQNGTAVPFNDPATKTEIWDNFYGSPSLQLVWAVPQDGVTAPADFNASASAYIKNMWKTGGCTCGTLTGPDSSGYYTATLTGTTIPANAVMVTGGVGFGYGSSTQPLTQTNVAGYPATASTVDATKFVGGLTVAAPTVSMVATDSTGKAYTARRTIVETARCNKCHEKLGVFTESSFHVGQRNDANTCAWCHTPNRTSSGWSVDSESFIHAIHAADKRTVPFTYTAASATDGFFTIGYPGVLQKCETCHLPGTYDFSASCVQRRPVQSSVPDGGYQHPCCWGQPSPYVTVGTTYGTSTATNLVSSPIAAACFSCHDGKMVSDSTQNVVDHMQGMGNGSIYQVRGTPGSGALSTRRKRACFAMDRIAPLHLSQPCMRSSAIQFGSL